MVILVRTEIHVENSVLKKTCVEKNNCIFNAADWFE